jgi:alkanesulfonate monooxygenase SsuD/methylene tetrahydromethanopterin reductase-like flavin-dependent oxidoreductase (luciferase family)
VGDIPVRFHHSIAFLPTNQVLPLARACDELGYGGIYVSDHIFNPRALASRYTYSVREDGAPGWEPETQWPDPMCLISGLATASEHLAFTTGVYIAPLRDLITVARTVGTAAVLSNNRVRLGVGVGWCKEEFDQTGQDFASRGPRLGEMIAALRALWRGGWVEFHGDYYDVPECQIEPAPTAPVPILGGGHSPVAVRRAAGREKEPFAIYLALNERPNIDMYRRFAEAGACDFVCAPWMFAKVDPGTPDDKVLADRLVAVRRFAEEIVAKV